MRRPPRKRKLLAQDFQQGSEQHLRLLSDMGIALVSLPDGRVQLLHTFANAATPEDGEEGLLFMQEMIELSRQASEQGANALPDTPPKLVSFLQAEDGGRGGGGGGGQVGGEAVRSRLVSIFAGPAQFGKLIENGFQVTEWCFKHLRNLTKFSYSLSLSYMT